MWVCFEKPDYFPNKVQLQNTEMTRINHELFCNALKHTWAIQLVDLSQDPPEKLVGMCSTLLQGFEQKLPPNLLIRVILCQTEFPSEKFCNLRRFPGVSIKGFFIGQMGWFGSALLPTCLGPS